MPLDPTTLLQWHRLQPVVSPPSGICRGTYQTQTPHLDLVRDRLIRREWSMISTQEPDPGLPPIHDLSHCRTALAVVGVPETSLPSSIDWPN